MLVDDAHGDNDLLHQIETEFKAKAAGAFDKMMKSTADTEQEAARALARLGGSEPDLNSIPRR